MLEQKQFLNCLPFHICIFLGFFFSVVASQIPLGSKLFASRSNSWVSSNENFAFGFFNRSDQPNQYSAGVRFNSNSIPFHEQRVVWVAGAEVSVSYDSYLHLTEEGDLVLFDSSKGVPAWTTNTSQFSVSSANLLDNGNLVLLNRDQVVVWQSFLTPTDTLLPGQNLSASQTLRAASRNSVSSYYSLNIDISGQLKLSWETNVPYWKTEALSSLPVTGAIFTDRGALQLLNKRNRPVWATFGEDHNDSLVDFRFLRLDVDGNLRMYSWVETSKLWRSVWQAVENQCNVFATCGLCGVCVFISAGAAVCKCPFGSTVDSNSQCLAPYKENCNSGSTMVEFEHTFLYGMYPPNDSITQTSLKECSESCLQDPLCTSVTVTNDGRAQCRTKQTRFISGYQHPSLPSTSFVKVCLDPVAAQLPSPPPPHPPLSLNQSRGFCIPCLVGAVTGTFVAFIAIQIGIGLCCFRKRKSTEKTVKLAAMDLNSRGLVQLSYSGVKDTTRDFKNQLGLKVYKGMLANNQPVAIKDVKAIERGVVMEEKQFRCALSMLGSIHHKNLAKMEGYCCESNHRFVVYEFARNGSVHRWLEEDKLSKKLAWGKRMDICVGVARAMAYLHTGCREFVSHGNLKWQNVVLDEEMEPKVTEFGLGRVVSGACDGGGTAGGDVAKFGEMVVMAVSGQCNAEVCRWAYEEWSERQGERVVDRRILECGGVDPEEVERALRVAFWCLQVDERLRPSMGEVVKVLEGTLSVDLPPSPFSRRTPTLAIVLSESESESEINTTLEKRECFLLVS